MGRPHLDEFGNPTRTDEDLEQDARLLDILVELVPLEPMKARVAAFLDDIINDYAKAIGDPASFADEIAEAFQQGGYVMDSERLAGEIHSELRAARDSDSSRRLHRVEDEARIARAELVRYWVNQLALASTLWGDEADGVQLEDDLSIRVPSGREELWRKRLGELKASFFAGVALHESGVTESLAVLRKAVRRMLARGEVSLPSFLAIQRSRFGQPVVVDRGTHALGGPPPDGFTPGGRERRKRP